MENRVRMLALIQNEASTSVTHISCFQAELLNDKTQTNPRQKPRARPDSVSALQEYISLSSFRHELNTIKFSPAVFRQKKIH